MLVLSRHSARGMCMRSPSGHIDIWNVGEEWVLEKLGICWSLLGYLAKALRNKVTRPG